MLDHFILTQSSLSHITHSLSRAELISAVNSIVDGLKSFSPTDSDPKAVQRRTHWLADVLDQEAISTEDQIALTAVLGATHIHEAKMDLHSTIQQFTDDYLAIRNDLLDAQSRISKLEDFVRVLTLQRTTPADSPKLAQRMELTSTNGQNLDLSVPKGNALVPLSSSRTPSPTPSSTNSRLREGERIRWIAEDPYSADAFEIAAANDKLRLHAVQEAKKTNTRLDETVGLADRSATPVASDANEVKDESVPEGGSASSTSAQAAARETEIITALDHLRSQTSQFKQFAKDEKLRLRAAQDAQKIRTRLEENVGFADPSRTHVAPDANKVKEESVSEHGTASSASGQAATSNEKQPHQNTFFTGNDKPLPPVPAAQAFPQTDLNHNSGKRKYTPTDVDPDPSTMAQKETGPSATTAFDSSPSSAATFALAKAVPAVTQSPQVVTSVRPKGKTTKWKDPPIFQDDEPTSTPTPVQFSVSSPAFNADGQSKASTGHGTENQKPVSQASQHVDPQQAPPKTSTPNENIRQMGSIVKVLQENKKLDEDRPLQKKSEKKPVFASADAMMTMVKSIAPDSGYVVSPKPAAAAAPANPAVPKTWVGLAASANKSVAMPAAPTLSPPAQAAKPAAAHKAAPTPAASQAAVAASPGYIVGSKPDVVVNSQAAVPRAPSVPSILPTAAPAMASRNDSTPPIDGSISQSSFLEAPQVPSKKRKSAVKLVKPETELVLPTTASSSTTSSSIKQENPAKASLPGSSAGPSTPQAPAVTSTRASTSPSTVATSSPLTPAQAPTIKITQAKQAMAASVSAPEFTPSRPTGTASSSSTSPSPKKEMAIPENLRKQMSASMQAIFTGNLKRG